MIRCPVRQVQTTEPAISRVQMRLLAKPTLGPDAEAIPDHQHPDHRFGIDRSFAGVTLESDEMRTDAGQTGKPV